MVSFWVKTSNGTCTVFLTDIVGLHWLGVAYDDLRCKLIKTILSNHIGLSWVCRVDKVFSI